MHHATHKFFIKPNLQIKRHFNFLNMYIIFSYVRIIYVMNNLT
jgi:hypothetical protein